MTTLLQGREGCIERKDDNGFVSLSTELTSLLRSFPLDLFCFDCEWKMDRAILCSEINISLDALKRLFLRMSSMPVHGLEQHGLLKLMECISKICTRLESFDHPDGGGVVFSAPTMFPPPPAFLSPVAPPPFIYVPPPPPPFTMPSAPEVPSTPSATKVDEGAPTAPVATKKRRGTEDKDDEPFSLTATLDNYAKTGTIDPLLARKQADFFKLFEEGKGEGEKDEGWRRRGTGQRWRCEGKGQEAGIAISCGDEGAIWKVWQAQALKIVSESITGLSHR